MDINEEYNKALAFFNQQKYDDSTKICTQIIDIDKNHYHTWNLLGNIFFNKNDLESAKQFFIAALNIKNDFVEAYYMLGNVLFQAEMFEDAINIWKEALKYKKSFAIIYSNISAAYIRLEEETLAISFAEEALDIDSKCEDAYLCLVNVYKSKMDLEKTKQTLQKLLIQNKENPEANFDLAYIYFIEKNYKKAYKHFEYRKKLDIQKNNYDYLPFKKYQRKPLKNKSLLVYHEQGFGDNIQFARFLNNIESNDISYGIQNSLNKLFSFNFPKIKFEKEIKTTKNYDFMIPSMSIPHFFNIYETLPEKYLKVEENDIIKFKDTFLDENKLNIGLVWSGSKTSDLKEIKSLELNDFEILFDEKRNFYSLQIENNEDLINYTNIKNIGRDFKDFYDTAVAISALDLIISVDTAVAHLTGALGKKGFILSNKMQFDWRWENKDCISLWYDSLKIFKYKEINSVMKKIDKEINEL